MSSPTNKPVVVIGDGWAALGSVGFLVTSGVQVLWVTGTGARMSAPLGSLEWGPGVGIWMELAEKLGIECGEPKHGIFVREFRNKAFRLPAWSQAPNLESRTEVRDEILWAPEQKLVGVLEARFARTLGEVEDDFRKKLISENFPNLKKIEGIPVTGFKSENGELHSVILGSGEEIHCEYALYADRWTALHGMEGLPKPLGFLRNRETVGVLQASFSHQPCFPSGIMESFFTELNSSATKENKGAKGAKSGDPNHPSSHIWGYMDSDGGRSVWTLCLSADEAEDNHEIAKKFRRMKTVLDKVFGAGGLISTHEPSSDESKANPGGRKTFSSTIQSEHVRFEENAIFASGVPLTEPAILPELNKISFLTDGYGPSYAFCQVGAGLGVHVRSLGSSESNAESANPLDSPMA